MKRPEREHGSPNARDKTEPPGRPLLPFLPYSPVVYHAGDREYGFGHANHSRNRTNQGEDGMRVDLPPHPPTDLMHKGKLDGFCLVSSDSDVTRLAQRLREDGLVVYGFGERKTPEAVP